MAELSYGSAVASWAIQESLMKKIGIYLVSDGGGGGGPWKIGTAGRMIGEEGETTRGIGQRIGSGRTWVPNLHVHAAVVVRAESQTDQARNNAVDIEKKVHSYVVEQGYAERIPFQFSTRSTEWFRLTPKGDELVSNGTNWSFPDYVCFEVICKLFQNDVVEMLRWRHGEQHPVRYVGCQQSVEVLSSGRLAGTTPMRTATGINRAPQRDERIAAYNKTHSRELENVQWRPATDLESAQKNIEAFVQHGRTGISNAVRRLLEPEAVFQVVARALKAGETVHDDAMKMVAAFSRKAATKKAQEAKAAKEGELRRYIEHHHRLANIKKAVYLDIEANRMGELVAYWNKMKGKLKIHPKSMKMIEAYEKRKRDGARQAGVARVQAELQAEDEEVPLVVNRRRSARVRALAPVDV